MDTAVSPARPDPFGARATLTTSLGTTVAYYRLAALAEQGLTELDRLPFTVRILLENVLRHAGGEFVDDERRRGAGGLAAATGAGDRGRRAALPAGPGRPAGLHRRAGRGRPGGDALGDGAARRRRHPDQPARAGRPGDRPLGPGRPLRHDCSPSPATSSSSTSATASATRCCAGRSRRSRTSASCRRAPASSTRSTWSTWPASSPPGRSAAETVAFPDTLVGTDSHTTMINGLGVLGWGVGGIEAEAVLLGQPLYQLTPEVVGVRLTGSLRPGATATDLVLAVTEMLRQHGVVGRFVEFCGVGSEQPAAGRPGDDRQHGAGVRRDRRASSRSTTRRCATCA